MQLLGVSVPWPIAWGIMLAILVVINDNNPELAHFLALGILITAALVVYGQS